MYMIPYLCRYVYFTFGIIQTRTLYYVRVQYERNKEKGLQTSQSQEIFASIQLNLGLQAPILMGNSRVPDMAVILNPPFLASSSLPLII